VLQNFRSYSQKKFDFHPAFTVVVGANTTGKTNLVEALMLLSSGKSFRAEKDYQMIAFGKDVAHVQALVQSAEEKTKLEVMLAGAEATGGRFVKKYTVNDVPKSRNQFAGILPIVLFRPEELDIIVDGPSLRRNFLDEVLELTDTQYRASKIMYDKALRQRNALLDVVRETGFRQEQQFAYWDSLLIEHGAYITNKREAFIAYVNQALKDVFAFTMHYDKSVMSKDRLLEYKQAEIGAGVTLVGPQRDDFFITMQNNGQEQNIQHFGSRGQQRLVILQLKLLHIAYTRDMLGQDPLLVLDDIFSELDSRHIQLVIDKVQGSQVILTTTHKEFVDTHTLSDFAMITLDK
jgi:DNA replication and repair protein RecF